MNVTNQTAALRLLVWALFATADSGRKSRKVDRPPNGGALWRRLGAIKMARSDTMTITVLVTARLASPSMGPLAGEGRASKCLGMMHRNITEGKQMKISEPGRCLAGEHSPCGDLMRGRTALRLTESPAGMMRDVSCKYDYRH
jgi:hypothetical protein